MGDPTDQQDPRYTAIMQGVQDAGRWTPDQSKNIADHLFKEVGNDPVMKRVDQVVVTGQGADDARIFAIYKPNSDQEPMFSKHVESTVRDTPVPPPTPAVDKDGYLTDPAITRNTIAALEKGELAQINAVVLHRTEGANAQSALDSFKSGTGTHFLIDKDGTIYQTASLDEKTQHVGKIKSRCMEDGTCTPEEAKTIKDMGWAPGKLHEHEAAKDYPDRFPMNKDSVGIEVVGRYNEATKTWDAPTPEQQASIAKLVGVLQTTYGLENNDVYQHDKISYKTPGEGGGLWQPPAPVVDAPSVQPAPHQR